MVEFLAKSGRSVDMPDDSAWTTAEFVNFRAEVSYRNEGALGSGLE